MRELNRKAERAKFYFSGEDVDFIARKSDMLLDSSDFMNSVKPNIQDITPSIKLTTAPVSVLAEANINLPTVLYPSTYLPKQAIVNSVHALNVTAFPVFNNTVMAHHTVLHNGLYVVHEGINQLQINPTKASIYIQSQIVSHMSAHNSDVLHSQDAVSRSYNSALVLPAMTEELKLAPSKTLVHDQSQIDSHNNTHSYVDLSTKSTASGSHTGSNKESAVNAVISDILQTQQIITSPYKSKQTHASSTVYSETLLHSPVAKEFEIKHFGVKSRTKNQHITQEALIYSGISDSKPNSIDEIESSLASVSDSKVYTDDLTNPKKVLRVLTDVFVILGKNVQRQMTMEVSSLPEVINLVEANPPLISLENSISLTSTVILPDQYVSSSIRDKPPVVISSITKPLLVRSTKRLLTPSTVLSYSTAASTAPISTGQMPGSKFNHSIKQSKKPDIIVIHTTRTGNKNGWIFPPLKEPPDKQETGSVSKPTFISKNRKALAPENDIIQIAETPKLLEMQEVGFSPTPTNRTEEINWINVLNVSPGIFRSPVGNRSRNQEVRTEENTLSAETIESVLQPDVILPVNPKSVVKPIINRMSIEVTSNPIFVARNTNTANTLTNQQMKNKVGVFRKHTLNDMQRLGNRNSQLDGVTQNLNNFRTPVSVDVDSKKPVMPDRRIDKLLSALLNNDNTHTVRPGSGAQLNPSLNTMLGKQATRRDVEAMKQVTRRKVVAGYPVPIQNSGSQIAFPGSQNHNRNNMESLLKSSEIGDDFESLRIRNKKVNRIISRNRYPHVVSNIPMPTLTNPLQNTKQFPHVNPNIKNVMMIPKRSRRVTSRQMSYPAVIPNHRIQSRKRQGIHIKNNMNINRNISPKKMFDVNRLNNVRRDQPHPKFQNNIQTPWRVSLDKQQMPTQVQRKQNFQPRMFALPNKNVIRKPSFVPNISLAKDTFNTVYPTNTINRMQTPSFGTLNNPIVSIPRNNYFSQLTPVLNTNKAGLFRTRISKGTHVDDGRRRASVSTLPQYPNSMTIFPKLVNNINTIQRNSNPYFQPKSLFLQRHINPSVRHKSLRRKNPSVKTPGYRYNMLDCDSNGQISEAVSIISRRGNFNYYQKPLQFIGQFPRKISKAPVYRGKPKVYQLNGRYYKRPYKRSWEYIRQYQRPTGKIRLIQPILNVNRDT